MAKKKVEERYYNPRRLLSYNCIGNIVLGSRGCGKSTAFLILAIKNFLKDGSQFCWLRRWKTEIKNDKNLFDAVMNMEEWKNVKFEVKGHKFYINDKLAGFSYALTQERIIRGIPHPNVKLIIFDEFVVNTKSGGKYISDQEPITFLEIVSSIARCRDDVRFVLLGNNLSYIGNPYLDYFKISIDINSDKDLFISPNKQVVAELTAPALHTEAMMNTRFGKLIADTSYGNYNLNNEQLNDVNKDFFMRKNPSDSKIVTVFYYNEDKIGLWYSDSLGIWLFNDKVDESIKLKYGVTYNDRNDGIKGIKSFKNSWLSRSLKFHFEENRVYYKDSKYLTLATQILRYIGCGI